MTIKSIRTFLLGGLLALIFAVTTCLGVHADAIVIVDEYIGGFASQPNNKYYNKDVIGNPAYFDILQMEIDYDNTTSNLSVSITSAYFDNIGKYGTQLGDLFISTDGWKPFGDAPYNNDNMLVDGEDWEYALVLDNHKASSGTLGLYAINKSDIIMSNSLNNSHNEYRKFQEVMVKDKVSNVLTTGSWHVDSNKLYMEINGSEIINNMVGISSGSQYLGFHWTMSCGNDVIEGQAAMVPEPSTMALLGICVMGILTMRARKNQGL